MAFRTCVHFSPDAWHDPAIALLSPNSNAFLWSSVVALSRGGLVPVQLARHVVPSCAHSGPVVGAVVPCMYLNQQGVESPPRAVPPSVLGFPHAILSPPLYLIPPSGVARESTVLQPRGGPLVSKSYLLPVIHT